MSSFLNILSILWGLFVMVLFFFKLKNYDLNDYKNKKNDVDGGFPVLVLSNWLLRKTPIAFIKCIVFIVGMAFIILGLIGLFQ